MILVPLTICAKGPSNIRLELEATYPPSIWYKGFEDAHDAPDLSRIKSYVVLEKGGLPAERAAFYISWGDYDYRGVTIDGDKISTRRGTIYTYLQKGDILAVTDTDMIGRTVYLKLMTPEIYRPENREGQKRFSRVTLQACFKIPKDVYKADDAQGAVALLGDWFRPFKNYDDAKAYAATIRETGEQKAN